MPRYHYERLRVACLHPIDFDLSDPLALRKAVECLKSIPDAKGTGISVETSVTAGPYKLRARVLLKLHDIIGKTPREVWELIDRRVDADRASLAKGNVGYTPASPNGKRPPHGQPLI